MDKALGELLNMDELSTSDELVLAEYSLLSLLCELQADLLAVTQTYLCLEELVTDILVPRESSAITLGDGDEVRLCVNHPTTRARTHISQASGKHGGEGKGVPQALEGDRKRNRELYTKLQNLRRTLSDKT